MTPDSRESGSSENFETVDNDIYEGQGESPNANPVGVHPIQGQYDIEGERPESPLSEGSGSLTTDGGVVEGIRDQIPESWNLDYDGRRLTVEAGRASYTIFDDEWASANLDQLYEDLESAEFARSVLEKYSDLTVFDQDGRDRGGPRTMWSDTLGEDAQY